ncbi:MAG: hypothetical protein JJE13_08985 [Thermoleophilia bacterium]|nr:hypothetical protein [Thermoleophilia bacterium]
MPIKESWTDPLPFWPESEELELGQNNVVFLPSSRGELDGEVVMGFRQEAQEMRVKAMDDGFDVQLFTPGGARPGILQEHAAEVVLPFLVAGVSSIPFSIIGDYIYDYIKSRGTDDSVFKVGLVEIEEGNMRIHNIEGPPADVLSFLEDASGQVFGDDDDNEDD